MSLAKMLELLTRQLLALREMIDAILMIADVMHEHIASDEELKTATQDGEVPEDLVTDRKVFGKPS